MKILAPDDLAIAEAAKTLAAGRLVAFPTETVYGLGANASDADALRRLYDAKGRPTNHPVIVHLWSVDQLSRFASHVPEPAIRLAKALWPGPLTLILPKATDVLLQVTGGQESVGLRIPNHPVALALLKKFGDGVAAPSANKFGRLSPTSAPDVAAEFADEVEIVLDGGTCDVGIESTIVDFSHAQPRILRPGMIVAAQIEEIAGIKLHSPLHHKHEHADQATRAPGGLPSHYAPSTPLRTVAGAQLKSSIEALISAGSKVCVLSLQPALAREIPWIVAPSEPHAYAHQLYGNLRKLDHERCDVIVVETVPQGEEWAGVADRLKRASSDTSSSQRGAPAEARQRPDEK